MKKHLIGIALALGALALLGWTSDYWVKPAKLTLGESGTTLTKAVAGTLTYPDSATTSATLTLAGIEAGDVVTVTPSTAYSGSAYIKSAVPSADKIGLTWSADPGTTVTVSVIAFKPI